MDRVAPFEVKDCALIAIATGKRAQNLRELCEYLRDIDVNCIYYHFWAGLLKPRFDNPEYHNDFAIWAAHSLHNKRLAEQLAIIDPGDFESLEKLRVRLLDTIEEVIEESQIPEWSKKDDQFEFIQSQIIVFDTLTSISDPEHLTEVIPHMSVGSVFYHFIDSRQRNAEFVDDFTNWLAGFGDRYEQLIRNIGDICPYFTSLRVLREQLYECFKSYFNRKG